MIISELRREDLSAPPQLDGTAATTWRDDRGNALARAARVGPWRWFRLERVATYRFPAEPVDGALRCAASPDEGVRWDEVVDQYHRTVCVFALEAYGYASLHAGAVETAAGAVVLTGPARAGKTTLALALERRGHRMVADDSVVLDPAPTAHPERPALLALPFVPRARSETAARYGVSDDRLIPAPSGPVRLGEELPVAAFVLLERRTGLQAGAPAATRLHGREAFASLLARAFLMEPAELLRDPRAVRDYLRLASRVPVYRLAYPSGFEVIELAAEAVEGLVSGQAGRGS